MTLSVNAKAAVFSQETDEVFLVLLTLDHVDITEPIRLVNNTEKILSNNNTFLPFPFRMSLPLDDSDTPPRAQLEVDNVDRQIVDAVRSISSAPSITIEIIMASDPDTIEASWTDFKLQDVSYNAFTVNGTLSVENFVQEPYPADMFVPSSFPGMF